MKQLWDRKDLEEKFTLTKAEIDLLPRKSPAGTLGFALLLKYLQVEGCFPEKKARIPKMVTLFMAEQLALNSDDFERFRWNGSEFQKQRSEIRKFCGYTKWSRAYQAELVFWLIANIPLQKHRHFNFARERSLKRLKELKVEPPREITLERIIFSSFKKKEEEVWVKHANRYRNPDEDLPKDFDEKHSSYYEKLGLPENADEFISSIKKDLEKSLREFNDGLPSNKYVEIRKSGTIKLSPLEAQEDPAMIAKMKAEIFKKWDIIPLLDAFKKADLYTGFSKFFESSAQRQILSEDVLRKRLLLSLYGLATNAGLKSVSFGNGEKYDDLLYVNRRFINAVSLRQAISHLVEQTFKIRQGHIWGDATVSCASDSKQFPSWDQNIMTEWHQRYSGRGIMIYWHVEKNSCCVYSHIKSCSSSEASAMIQGVLNHETSMEIEKQYVDTHGQSYVAFSFCHLLGFQLLPRFHSVKEKKLFLPSLGIKDELKNLEGILTRAINWDLIKQQYNEMVRFTTALKMGTASAESILRRFTRNNMKHPTYQALVELGKAIRTIFLCKYLSSAELRKEIHEGLNIIEQWNGVNDFIFFGKGREFSSNSRKQQEISALSLHLLQNSLVYLNTLMIQDILEDPVLFNQFDQRDFKALNPLFYAHINPYGTFDLDFTQRLDLSMDGSLQLQEVS